MDIILLTNKFIVYLVCSVKSSDTRSPFGDSKHSARGSVPCGYVGPYGTRNE